MAEQSSVAGEGDLQDALQTGRVLNVWLPEIPVQPLSQSYVLTDRELGRGGFGRVVVGTKLRLPQQVAIKRMHDSLQFSPADQRRFVREVQLLARLNHPNIVRVEDWGRDSSGLYIVMELIDGTNLADLVQSAGAVSVPQLLDFTRQICQALKWAHQQGIVHRDLKPANLLLDAFGIVKLVDFGLARVDPNLRESLASSRGAGMFTFAYASPEQLEGQTEIDSRSDLFSLGATLHHLVTGKPPLTRNYSLKLVPVVLRPLLERLLEHEPEERFQSVSEVLQMISDLSQGGAGPTAPESGPAVAARQPAAAVSALVVPFSASAAKSAQRALSRQLGQAEELTNDLEMKFRLIPGGTFAMGSAAGQGSKDEHPQHRVTLSHAFYLGVHTVTQGQWQQLMGTTPWQGQSKVKTGGTIAATYISWQDSVEFCQRLSARDGRRYRLPTEAEWEWSCRAGKTTQYSFGDDEKQLGGYAWYDGNSRYKSEQHAHAVGQKRGNPFGLYDMHGNVWEWCSDWYDDEYYAASPEQDPAGPASGSSRVLRGGGWRYGPIALRSCFRYYYAPDDRDFDIGLRVLCELE